MSKTQPDAKITRGIRRIKKLTPDLQRPELDADTRGKLAAATQEAKAHLSEGDITRAITSLMVI